MVPTTGSTCLQRNERIDPPRRFQSKIEALGLVLTQTGLRYWAFWSDFQKLFNLWRTVEPVVGTIKTWLTLGCKHKILRYQMKCQSCLYDIRIRFYGQIGPPKSFQSKIGALGPVLTQIGRRYWAFWSDFVRVFNLWRVIEKAARAIETSLALGCKHATLTYQR